MEAPILARLGPAIPRPVPAIPRPRPAIGGGHRRVGVPVGPAGPAGRRANPQTALHTLRMEPTSLGDNSWPDEPGTYWRRRVFALAVGLGLLGLLAWACSGALSAGPTEKVTVSRTSPAAQQAGAPG